MNIIKRLESKYKGYTTRTLNLNEFIKHNCLDMILNNNFSLESFDLYNYDELYNAAYEEVTSNLEDYFSEDEIIEIIEDEFMNDIFDDALHEYIYSDEIYQFFIVREYDVDNYWIKYTKYPIYYNDEIDLYLLGITHFGMSWKYFNTTFEIREYL